MKTYSQKPAEVTRKWYVVDATQAPLGRLATQVAKLLLGKDKPTFTPHVDGGDYVIVVNASKLVVTGDKLAKKVYYRHTHFPGGLKQRTLGEQLQQDPTVSIKKAVRGMLPVNKLRDGRLLRLKVYSGPEHEHEAQKPENFDLGGNK